MSEGTAVVVQAECERYALAVDEGDLAKGRLLGALMALPCEQRLAVLLHDIAGLSHEEIASRVGWPLPEVRAQVNRGRVRLYRSMEVD